MTSSIIGIDVGSSTAYVAKVEHGGVVLLTNELNSRCTPTVLSFPTTTHGTRNVGATAQPHLVTQSSSSVSDVTGLLGANVIDPRNHREVSKLVNGSTDNKIGVRLYYAGQHKTFLPEQLVACILKHLKKISVDGSENSVNPQESFFVLSAPNYFTDSERCALLDAARIAGMNVIHLTNDLTAAALAYGYFQKNLPDAPLNISNDVTNRQDVRLSAPPIAEKPRLVAFVDFGHSGIQSGIVAFSSSGLRVLATQTDRTVGGRDFDRKLSMHLVDLFNLQHESRRVQIVPESQPKVVAKLLVVAEKLKKQMSANRNVLPVEVECLLQDLDLRGQICRDTFEKLCTNLFEKVRNNLVRLIQTARISPGDLHSVEILGGSSRIPMFKTIVEEVFGLAPSTSLNADEAVARGCALMCALNTKVFKVKPFAIRDCVHFSTQLKYTTEVQESSSSAVLPAAASNSTRPSPPLQTVAKTVFSKNCPVQNSTSVIELDELPHEHTLAIGYCSSEDDYGKTDLSLITKPLIAIYNIDPQVTMQEGERLQLEFFHDAFGIIRLKSVKLIQAAKRLKFEESSSRERCVKFSEVRVGGLTRDQLQSFVAEENFMEDVDTKEKLREETKNRLEELTFSLRDDLDSLDEVVKREEAWAILVKHVKNLSDQFEKENYENAPIEAYQSLLQEMQKKKTVFNVWLQKFNQKREFESLGNRRLV